jgi:hypothetical protein
LTPSLIAACLWLLAANVVGLIPSRRRHWPQAYALIAIGLPVLVWVFSENPPWIGALVLLAGASILRWPVYFLLRWAGRKLRGRG